jgi:methylmalonyl-CoA/ethylmalonyl-CoA epimerase
MGLYNPAVPNLHDARIGQIAVVCKDVARARAFYGDTLGLRHLFDAGPSLSFFECRGLRLMLTTGEGTDLGTMSSMIYYFVDDIDATWRDLSAKGVAFPEKPHVIAKMPDHDLWLAAFTDSEGNMMGIMEERRG